MSKIFLDTNVFVYAFDISDKSKQSKCKALIKDIGETSGRTGVISTQVLKEFFVTCTRKLGIDPLETKGHMALLQNFDVVQVTPYLIDNAVDCSILSKISFRDALIITSAQHAKCSILYSEDLNHDQIIKGVKIQNPFI